MKSKYVVLASALMISVSTFAQKDQIKAAEKALKNGNSTEAKTILLQAESLIGAATDSEKAQYYFVKGNTLLDLANKKIDVAKNQLDAAKAYQDLIAVEKISGKSKYTSQAETSITDIKGKLLSSAIEDGTNKKYSEASKTLYTVYELDKSDLEKLYYAASYAVNAQEYDTALSYYNELKAQNFSGEGMSYFAKNVLTEKEDYFGTTPEAKADRDSKVKLKVYIDPRDEKIPSKRGEIYKNIALILVQEGKVDEAKKALSEARVANPDDSSLTLTEADLYLKLEDFTTYKKLISEVLEKNPNDPDLLFNLGVISAKTDAVEAEKYYKKAIDIKPDYVNAYLNLAILKLDGEKKIIDEMNKLGTSEKDNKRYEVLKKQRLAVFMDTLPFLEKANELDPKNEDVSTTLLNVYGALEMSDKKKALKAKLVK
ncbi:tetratricopeptide repeat protein [Flavobacterium myungsuense]|uniref:Tetratricopeptide repeat protein n=2 Tax=Flavobacterium myungsuense TaxID=651823 RepID=A0ABW3J0X0_9FLAO